MIRSAEPEDEVELFDLVAMFPTPTRIDRHRFRQQFLHKLGDSQFCLMVAERDENLVGYISGHRHAAFYASGEVAWVDELFVTEECRGTGIGRELMQSFERWASESECRLVGLATDGAREFYERMEFESKAGYYKKYLGDI